MASLKAEKSQLPAEQAKKEPKASGCCGNAPKATKQATNKAEQKPRETKKKASGGKAVAKNQVVRG